MNLLWNHAIGWFSYLERAPVVVQLLVPLGALLIGHSLNYVPRNRLPRRLRRSPWLLEGGLMAAGLMVLALMHQPLRLALSLTGLYVFWLMLGFLRQQLGRVMKASVVHRLDTRLLRPAFLVVAVLTLISWVDNLQVLATIPLGKWFGVSVQLGGLLLSCLVIYLLLVGSGVLAAVLAWILQKGFALQDDNRRAVTLILRYAVVALGITLLFDQIGFNGAALVAVAGGLSVGLGFGIKEVFSNFISGLWLLFEGSVRPGDILFLEGDPCEVRSLGLRAAVLWRDRDNAELVIPNQTFFTNTTITYTGSDRLRRSEVQLGVAYRHDPDEVIPLLVSTARSVEGVLPEPTPRAYIVNYDESSIRYTLRFWIDNPMNNLSTSSAIRKAIWKNFEEHGIEIPFPQHVIHKQN
ncbi:MAG: mechanosensitive ion channel family protein [Cyanobacteriota bacterium]